MNVCLFYIDALRPGGYPRDARWLATALSELGVRVSLVCQAHGSNMTREGLCDRVRVMDREKFEQEIRHADVVHFFGLFLSQHIGPLVRAVRFGVKTVVSPLSHLQPIAMTKSRWKKKSFLHGMRPWLRRVSAFHVFSATEAASLESWSFLRERARFEASLGVFPLPELPASLTTRPPDGKLRILFMGRNAIRQKGIDLLVKAFCTFNRGLVEAEQRRCELEIAGQDFDHSDAWLRAFIERAKLQRQVTLRGAVSEGEKFQRLAAADVLVFLSRYDGPPRPIREAITVGTPVVVSYESNLGELVREHNAGAAVGLATEAVARCLEEIWQNRERLIRWREGVVELKRRLEWPRVAADYLEGYARCRS